MNINLVQLFFLLLMASDSFAKDFGIHGTVYKVQEESLIDCLMKKLKELNEEDLVKINQKISMSFIKPSAKSLPRTKEYRCYYYDPSVTLKEDIKDKKGNVILKKGTFYNPLEHFSLREDLILCNGNDQAQVEWAKQFSGKIILEEGNPMELEKSLQRPIYFDQFGQLAKKFGLTSLPVKISQNELLLKIEEIPLKDNK